MKILFLHLSDAHFRENTKFNDININAIVNSLKQIDKFDECVLVFSGDIAYSGEINQYKRAEEFIGILIKQIKDYYLKDKLIHTLFVPGNHDNLVKNSSRNVEELKAYYSDPNEIDRIFYSELGQLENFYKFANRNFCFKKGKIVDVRKIKFGEFTIKVNLINTAPFSLLCTGNEDKGLHYIPQKEIDKLDFDMQEDYTISIIHHSPEWFSDNSKQSLYNKLYETSDLIFIGHEHFPLSETKIVNGKFNIDISNGLALYGTDTDHGYNTLLLDTEKRILEGTKFIYNGSIYKPKIYVSKHTIQFRRKSKFVHTQEFTKFLETDFDERNGENYLDYFVFPSLETKSINNTMTDYSISTEKKFFELFSVKRKISIEGSSKAGKTTLTKYLCRSLMNNYVPIYLNENSFSPKDNDKIIKYAFSYQYGDDADFDEFWQLDLDKRVLIVDNYDRINNIKWKEFLNDFSNKFGHIIFVGGIDWNINIKEKTLEELSDNNIFYLKICPFYYTKREQLIQKICINFKDKKILDIEEKARKINEDITDQIRYFQLNPDFIHQYVDYYLSFSYTKTQKDGNVFSKVFEANLTFRLTKYAGEENVSEIMIALDYIAHYIHFNKKYPLPLGDFEKVIESYTNEYDNNLNPKFVRDVAIKANIIREVTDKFNVEFCDSNLLAYFTASHLNRKFNDGQGQEELKYILDNICFQPNGDIVLFLSYITSNVQILNPIITSLVEHMKEWDELNIDVDNIGYLTKLNVSRRPKLPDHKSKTEIKNKKSNMEKEIFEKYKNDSESLYSYDESRVDSFGNKISKGISYLELLAKILPNFRHILKGEQKRMLVDLLYKYPNKLLYFMLKDIDNNHDRIINDILDVAPKTKKGKLITKGMISKAMQNQSIGYILSIYDFIASTAVNVKTISDLNKYDYRNNTNYYIQNIMMEENAVNFDKMAHKAEELYKNTKIDIVKYMITLVVRKYLLCHNVSLIGENQRLLDVFFEQNKEQKKNIKMAQAKNMFIKK